MVVRVVRYASLHLFHFHSIHSFPSLPWYIFSLDLKVIPRLETFRAFKKKQNIKKENKTEFSSHVASFVRSTLSVDQTINQRLDGKKKEHATGQKQETYVQGVDIGSSSST